MLTLVPQAYDETMDTARSFDNRQKGTPGLYRHKYTYLRYGLTLLYKAQVGTRSERAGPPGR